MFHVYLRWSPQQRSRFIKNFRDNSSPLVDMMYHFQQRLQWARSPEDSEEHRLAGTRLLGLAQTKLICWIADRWSLCPRGRFGDSVIWFQNLLEASNLHYLHASSSNSIHSVSRILQTDHLET